MKTPSSGSNSIIADGLEISDSDFKVIKKIINEKVGIKLESSKKTLVETRLQKRIRVLGLKGYRDYVKYLKLPGNHLEVIQLIDVMTTNTTHFFREPTAFEAMEEYIKKCLKAGQKKFRIWCAASSTGEEPYTIAMLLSELFDESIDYAVLATDISTKVIKDCKKGTYSHKNVQKIPKHLLTKYFEKQDDSYTVSDKLKSKITFNRLNLIEQPYPMSGPLDLIFCRNVMIYFTNSTSVDLLMEMHRLLRKDGRLIVGSAESLTGMNLPYKVISPSVYRNV